MLLNSLRQKRYIGYSLCAAALLVLSLAVWSPALQAAGSPPGRPPNPGGQGSIAVMVMDFELVTLLDGDGLVGSFAVQNKDPLKNGTLIVPDSTTPPDGYMIKLEQRIGREWQELQVSGCDFDPPSLELPDEQWYAVGFECAAEAVDPDANSVRVTALVPLDGRVFLSRHSQKIY